MNEIILRNLAQQALADPIYPDPRFPPSAYYRFLYRLAEYQKPSLSVELGVCGGGGSLHLALGWDDGIVCGVDVGVEYQDNLKYLNSNCPNFKFWLGDSVMAAKQIAAKYGLVDILFIDTIHTYDRTIAEFQAWRPYLASNAVVCFDDLLRAEMAGLWEWLPEPKLRLDALHDGSDEGGFGVIWNG